ncbi:SDR family oxidoreductase [Deinococcus cellulosilyticus]|nr:SDR family oxidoreductase [Deinococcus cellulosilyticus]
MKNNLEVKHMEDTPMEKPGYQKEMTPRPEVISKDYKPAGKLEGQVAIISGGDSGIGRSVAVAFAAEGADVAIIYLEENEDARDTRKMVEKWGKKCLLIAGDVGKPEFCEQAVQRTLEEFGKLDIVVNNAAEQTPQEDFMKITPEQLEKTFRTNIFGYFFLTRAAMPHLKEGARIINTTSVTAYRGSPGLVDYSATKGAIVAFTRSLSGMLAEQKIRVNGVAPGPIWTPLIPSTFPEDKVEKFGEDTPLGRPGQPSEVATCFVFLASQDSSYITGQVLHPNGGEIING